MISVLQTEVERCGGEWAPLSAKERWAAIQQWREVFVAVLHAQRGKWRFGKYEWHVFSYEFARAISGPRAIQEYLEQPASLFFLVPEHRALPAYYCRDGDWPDFRDQLVDVRVWPDDLAWTMAFTHEEEAGLGPYFCRREWGHRVRRRFR
jgi:hypothetical protein